jgi:hypothetical protein
MGVVQDRPEVGGFEPVNVEEMSYHFCCPVLFLGSLDPFIPAKAGTQFSIPLIPAKAGTPCLGSRPIPETQVAHPSLAVSNPNPKHWVPAFAGMSGTDLNPPDGA